MAFGRASGSAAGRRGGRRLGRSRPGWTSSCPAQGHMALRFTPGGHVFRTRSPPPKCRMRITRARRATSFLTRPFPRCGDYQAKLLRALLERYPFDGVALDWLRYNERANGASGPLAAQFAGLAGKPWSAEAMAEPHLRAMWDDLRAREVAGWVKELLAELRPVHPERRLERLRSAMDVQGSCAELPASFRRRPRFAAADDLLARLAGGRLLHSRYHQPCAVLSFRADQPRSGL